MQTYLHWSETFCRTYTLSCFDLTRVQMLTSVCRARACMEAATTESTNTCAFASQDTLAPTARLVMFLSQINCIFFIFLGFWVYETPLTFLSLLLDIVCKRNKINITACRLAYIMLITHYVYSQKSTSVPQVPANMANAKTKWTDINASVNPDGREDCAIQVMFCSNLFVIYYQLDSNLIYSL